MTEPVRRVALAVLATVALTPVFAAGTDDAPAETRQQRDTRMAWWREARFGMFVHWGLYAIAAGQWDEQTWERGGMEWIQRRANVPADVYAERLLPQFKPKQDFAREWAKLAKDAGCKYVVFTDKHHEGFALHDSDVTKFDAKDVTGRDLCREIVDAVRDHGLRVGLYHSLWDWHHPHAYAGAGTNNPPCQTMAGREPAKYLDFLNGQVEEIVSRYGRLDVLWFDYSSREYQGQAWRANELMALARRHQPGIIINNRLYRSPEAGWFDDHHLEPFDSRYGDFCTPEQRIPPTGVPGVDWETCMTINTTWGYSKFDHAWKSSQVLIRNLVDIASKGGNYLLNIGPMADGTVPPECVERMEAIGRWMAVNGESIYGTVASPFAELAWGRCTMKRRGDTVTLYLHVFDWPTDGSLVVPGLQNTVGDARLLVGGAVLKVAESDRGPVLHVPAEAPDVDDTVIAIEIEGEPRISD